MFTQTSCKTQVYFDLTMSTTQIPKQSRHFLTVEIFQIGFLKTFHNLSQLFVASVPTCLKCTSKFKIIINLQKSMYSMR